MTQTQKANEERTTPDGRKINREMMEQKNSLSLHFIIIRMVLAFVWLSQTAPPFPIR